MKEAIETSIRIKQYGFLFLATLFIRLPFFARDYTDRDESTFIIMGQSVADGFMPYVHLWDLKPPLLFFIFGAVEYIFPDSLVAIRMIGVLAVFIAAVFILKIASKGGFKNGFVIALAFVMLGSEFGNLQGVMSEHLAIAFLLPGLYFFLSNTYRSIFIAGFLFGSALLCKLSLAYGITAMMLVYPFLFRLEFSLAEIIKRYFIVFTGILLPFLLMAIPYYTQGHARIFLESVFLAPLEYSNAMQLSALEKLERTWWVILLVLVVIVFIIRRISKENKVLSTYCIAILTGTVYTFYSSGIVNGHYMIQLYPFMVLLLGGVAIKKRMDVKKGWLAIIVIVLSFESLREYYLVARSYKENGTLHYRQAFIIADSIKGHGLEKEKIWFLDYHIGYWLLNQYPLTKSTTHPSNINRPFLFKYFGNNRSTLEEVRYILDSIRPKLVVSKYPSIAYLEGGSRERDYFDSVISIQYEPLFRQPEKAIYSWKRK